MRSGAAGGKKHESRMNEESPNGQATLKGILLLVTGTLFMSMVPVLSKVVLEEMPSIHFSALWMLSSSLWGAIWLFRKGFREPWRKFRLGWRPIVVTGALAAVWVYCYYRGLERLNPATTTFLVNSRIVWAMLIGVVFLRERYRGVQLLGILTVAFGILVIFSDVGRSGETTGVAFILLSALVFVLGNAVIKRYAPDLGVPLVLFARFFFPALLLAPASFAAGSLLSYLTVRNAVLIAAGTLIGPFLSFLMIYTALMYLNLGIHTAFQSVGIVFSALFTFLVFGTMPPAATLIGGGLIAAGLTLVGIVSARRQTPGKPVESVVPGPEGSPGA